MRVVVLVAAMLAAMPARGADGTLATGGFGRREFAPHSDLDLVFLCATPPDAQTEALARAVLHPLWDAKIDAGHAVRSLNEALELPASDLTAATALLDARHLAGDRSLADRFFAEFGARVAGASPDGFVARLRVSPDGSLSRMAAASLMFESGWRRTWASGLLMGWCRRARTTFCASVTAPRSSVSGG